MQIKASLVILILTGALAACGGGSTAPTPTPTPNPTPNPPSTTYGPNLIVNPGAEVGGAVTSTSTRPFPLPGWTTVGTPSPTGVMDAESYDGTGDLHATDPGPSDRGLNYFSGGGAGDTATATQTISLSSRASDIDANKVGFDLSGWLGGFDNQNDNAVLSVSFLNSVSVSVGSVTSIGPVLAADRQNATGLLFRDVKGSVPVGARSAVVTLVMTRTDGSYNDGYADNLNLQTTQ